MYRNVRTLIFKFIQIFLAHRRRGYGCKRAWPEPASPQGLFPARQARSSHFSAHICKFTKFFYTKSPRFVPFLKKGFSFQCKLFSANCKPFLGENLGKFGLFQKWPPLITEKKKIFKLSPPGPHLARVSISITRPDPSPHFPGSFTSLPWSGQAGRQPTIIEVAAQLICCFRDTRHTVLPEVRITYGFYNTSTSDTP